MPFTEVHGDWNVPAVTGTAPLPYTASCEWVGIDGVNTPDVMQTGTEQDALVYDAEADPVEFENYYAWYEYFPDHQNAIAGLDVRPGDDVSPNISP